MHALRIWAAAATVAGLALTSSPAVAQTPYVVSHATETWTPITGGTTYAPVAYGAFAAWDEGSAAIPLPFPFNWYGTDYNVIHAYTNGFVSFSAPPGGGGLLSPPNIIPSTANPIHNFIAAMWQDLTGGVSPEMRAVVSGAAPNRVFTIQMSDLRSFSNPSSSVSFQIRLYEGDDSVEVVMGPNFGITNATTAMENATGSDGLNLLANGPTCGAGCACTPRNCGSLNWPQGRRIAIDLPIEPELIGTVVAPPGAHPGTMFDALVTVRNLGLTASAGFQYRLLLTTTNTSTAGGTLLQSVTLPGLAASTTYTSTRTLTIPPATPVGTFYVAIVVDALNQVPEVLEVNNVAFSGAMATGPDLRGTVTVPASTGPGETLVVGLTLQNAGAPVVTPVQVQFYLSPMQTLGPGATPVGAPVTITMPNGFSYTGNVMLTTPASLQPSPPTYYLLAQIDPTNAVVETNEANNLASSTTTVQVIGADLDAVSFEGGPFGFRGLPYPLTAVVENDGGATATNFTVCIYLSDNLLISVISDTQIAQTPLMTLAPGASATIQLEPIIPANTSTGTWYIAAVADCDGAIPESLETNNTRRRVDPIIVRDPSPDFVALEIATSSSAAAGETIPVSFRIGNLGNAAGAAHVRLVLSDNPGITTDDITIFQTTTPISLTPPNDATLSVWGRVPGNVVSGNYYVGALIDPANAIDETFEDNNTISVGPLVVVGVDLVIVTPPPPNGTLGVPYVRRFNAVGGAASYVWSLTWASGAAPAGLSFDPTTATLSGTPENAAEGSHAFTVEVASGNLSASRDYSMVITPPTLPLSVVSSRLPPALAGERYMIRLVAVGGVAPYTWTQLGGLPAGLGLSADGQLGGEPQLVGPSNFQVRVTDAIGVTATGLLVLNVVDPSASVTINTADVPSGTVNTPYEMSFTAAGGASPYAWRLDGVIPGLDFAPGNAALTGTPTVAGDYPIVVEVRDATGLIDRNGYVLEILEEGQLRITSGQSAETALPRGKVGATYVADDGTTVRLRAVPPEGLVWSVVAGSLPNGLLLDASTGALSGTPSAAGVFPFIVFVRNQANDFRRASLVIVIDEADATVTPPGDGGCGCSAAQSHGTSSGLWWTLSGLALFGAWRRRRGVSAVILGGGLLMGSTAEAQPVPYQVFQEPATYAQLGPSAQELLPGLGDGNSVPIPLPFNIYLYGQPYSQIWVNANGFITVTSVGTGFHFAPPTNPRTAAPNGFVAGLWDDWCSSVSGCFGPTLPGRGVFYRIDPTPGQGSVAVEFRSIGHFSDELTPSNINFTIRFHEGPSSLIELSYGTIAGGTDFLGLPVPFSARIGIENLAGTEGMFVGPCAGATACSLMQAQQLSNQRITIVADAGEDVTASSVSVPEIGYPGLPMDVAARILSRHQNPIGPFSYAAYIVPATATSTAAGRLGFQSTPITLAGFESRLVSFGVEVPNDLAPGQYRVALVVDNFDTVDETAETNNLAISAQTVRIADRAPDFRVRRVRPLQTQVMPGQMLDIAYRVENFGNEPGVMDMQVVLSANEAITTSDLPLGAELRLDAMPRQSFTGTVSAQIPATVRTGTYFVGIILDPHQNVAELDEANNIGRQANPITVVSTTVQIVTNELPPATVGISYEARIRAAGGDGRFTYRLVNGALPRGMVFNATEASIFGIPLEIGSFTLEFEARSGSVTGRKSLDLVVLDPTYPLTIVSRTMPQAVLGSDYVVALRAAGGQEPYVWRIIDGGLPGGIGMAPDGVIFGSPRNAEFTTFTVQLRDNASTTATVGLSLEVRSPGNLTVVSGDLPAGRLGEPYSQALFSSGGVEPVTWRAVTTPPAGLLIGGDGAVNGIPEKVGTFRFRVEATDSVGNTDTNELGLTVESSGRFAIVTTVLPVGEPNTDYRALVRAEGGDKPYTWELVRGEGALPAGFEAKQSIGLNEGETEHDLVISGRLEREGVWAFTVRAIDARGRITETPLAIVSESPPPPPLPDDPGGCSCSARPVRATDASETAASFLLGTLLLFAARFGRGGPRRARD